jgi:YggT family protein
MEAIRTIFQIVTWAVLAIGAAGVVLILLRSLVIYMDVNPFTWSALTLRRLTDPIINRVRRALIGLRIEPRVAPFIAIVLIIIIGVLMFLLASNVLNTIAGIVDVVTHPSDRTPVAIVGYLIFGFLGLYTLLIFFRILFSYLVGSYGSRLMRFLIRSTEPLLAPLRRMIPPVRMFDISPIVAFIILYLLQAIVVRTLLQGREVQFF